MCPKGVILLDVHTSGSVVCCSIGVVTSRSSYASVFIIAAGNVRDGLARHCYIALACPVVIIQTRKSRLSNQQAQGIHFLLAGICRPICGLPHVIFRWVCSCLHFDPGAPAPLPPFISSTNMPVTHSAYLLYCLFLHSAHNLCPSTAFSMN